MPGSASTGGRPSKFDKRRASLVLKALRAGNFAETAARAAGVSPSTLYAWAAGNPEFSEAIESARATAETRDVARVNKAAGKTWRAAAWRLERRAPRRWGLKVSIAVREELEGALDHLEGVLDADTFRRVVDALDAWDGTTPEGSEQA